MASKDLELKEALELIEYEKRYKEEYKFECIKAEKVVKNLTRLYKNQEDSKRFYKKRIKEFEKMLSVISETLVEDFRMDADTVAEIYKNAERRAQNESQRDNIK